MKIAEKIKGFGQSKEDEQNTMIIKGVKYKSVKNGWVPILNVPTVSIFDFSKTES
jgi:hypothetical protein